MKNQGKKRLAVILILSIILGSLTFAPKTVRASSISFVGAMLEGNILTVYTSGIAVRLTASDGMWYVGFDGENYVYLKDSSAAAVITMNVDINGDYDFNDAFTLNSLTYANGTMNVDNDDFQFIPDGQEIQVDTDNPGNVAEKKIFTRFFNIRTLDIILGMNSTSIKLYDIDITTPEVNQSQAAPTGLDTVVPSVYGAADGKITGTTTAMEYQLNGAGSYTAVTANEITGLAAGTYNVRYAAKTGYDAGAATEVVIVAGPNASQAAPTGLDTVAPSIFGAADGKITGTTTAMEYQLNGAGSYTAVTATEITGLAAGTYNVRYAAKTGYDAGTAAELVIAAGPNASQAAPIGLDTVAPSIFGAADGKITGTTTAMEYQLNGTGSYTAVTATEITGLAAGTYNVRYAAKTGYDAGAATEVVIAAGPNASQTAPTGNNNVSTPVKTEGKIKKEQKRDETAPAASLNNSSKDLKSMVLSTADQEQVASGKDAKVLLKINDISTSVSEEDKKQIEKKLAAEQQGAADTALLYVDISLFKQIGDGEETRITQTSGKISISIEIPKDMWNTNEGIDRTYHIVRVHDGVAELLEGIYDPITHLFTFETDRFSTYALTYQDVNTTTAKSGGNTTDKLTGYNGFNHLRLNAKAAKTSQKLNYVKVSGADGYLIYGAKCGQPLKELAAVKGTVTSYTVKNLKQSTYYKYQVKAYKIIGEKKVIITTSKVVHSITENKTYANPIKVTTDVTSVKFSVGNTRTVTCQVLLPKGKKLKQHTAVTRYESTNKVIATVNSSGKITAKAKGTCYVYVYAQNGVYIKIKITVK